MHKNIFQMKILVSISCIVSMKLHWNKCLAVNNLKSIYQHCIFTPDNIWWGGDYIVTLYFHSWQYLVRGWLYRDIIFSLLEIFGEGVIISWHYISIPGNIWWGDNYIVTLYFHPWQYLVWGWLYRDIIFSLWQYLVRGWLLYRDIVFSLLMIFGAGVIISWHHIIIPDTTLESGTGGDYIWIFSLSKFDCAVIPGNYHSYPHIHPMKFGIGGWSDYI